MADTIDFRPTKLESNRNHLSIKLRQTFAAGICHSNRLAEFYPPSIHPHTSSPVWRLSPMAVLTDTPSNTYCRAPGSTQVKAINCCSFETKYIINPFSFSNMTCDHLLSGTRNNGDSDGAPGSSVEDRPSDSQRS